MRRFWCALMAVAFCAGCRNQPQVYDPFLGRTTIEPPGTATPAPGQPYYSAPPSSTLPGSAPTGPPIVTPPAGTAPPASDPAPIPHSVPQGFTPAPAGLSSFSPNVSPQNAASGSTVGGSNPTPITPVSSPARPVYGPPGGGWAYPQTSGVATPGTSTLAQPNPPAPLDIDRTVGSSSQPTPATTSSKSGVVPAKWEAADESASANNSARPASFSSPTQRSTIRIIEPPQSSVAASSNVGGFRPGGTSSLSMPSGGVSHGTLNQSLTKSRTPELSELPPVPPVSARGPQAAPSASRAVVPAGYTAPPRGASLAASNGAPSVGTAAAASAPSRSSYEYDSQYRWLKGKLEYSQSARRWRLRYIPSDSSATDDFGGSVILDDTNKLAGLQAGDFIVAHGSLGPTDADKSSFAPLYHLERIQKQ